jgi:hypothetical protein
MVPPVIRPAAPLQRDTVVVTKISWQKAGQVTEPGRYMLRFGWLTVTAEDLAVWKQFPDALFTLVEIPGEAKASEGFRSGEFRLGTFELPVGSRPSEP